MSYAQSTAVDTKTGGQTVLHLLDLETRWRSFVWSDDAEYRIFAVIAHAANAHGDAKSQFRNIANKFFNLRSYACHALSGKAQ